MATAYSRDTDNLGHEFERLKDVGLNLWMIEELWPHGSGLHFGRQRMVPEASVLRSYIEATRANALEHLRGMDDATLESTSVAGPVGGQLTLTSVYQQMVWELNQHGGQIAYLRGMQRGIEDPMDVGTVFESARDAG